ncbi:MAG: SPFH domain-containing protein [Clostridia bacterium]
MNLFLIVLVIFVLVIAAASIKVVRQSEVRIIERFGKYNNTAIAGLNFILPFIDKVRAVVSLKQQTMDVTPQSVITKDNVTITIDTVVFYQIMDPVKAVYEIESLQKGIAYIAITTIRDIVGKMDLDSTFSSRDEINTQLRDVLDDATDRWGCKVDRVEIKDIKPPVDIRDAMEKQMNAERTKRANILEAEGKRQAEITLAEGKKQATILDAEAEKESSIRRAQGFREARVLEAEGNADAIKKVAEAKAQEVTMVYKAIMDAKPDQNLVAIKSLEALEKVSEGAANKIFIPFDATKAMGALGAATEIIKSK